MKARDPFSCGPKPIHFVLAIVTVLWLRLAWEWVKS